MPRPRIWVEDAPRRLCAACGHDKGSRTHLADCSSLSEFANPECGHCGGAGETEAGDPCPECIVGVWT